MRRNHEIDKLLDGILVDAYGEDEQLWAFRQAFEDEVELPADATVIGENVRITKIDYDGKGASATASTRVLPRLARVVPVYDPIPRLKGDV